MEKTPSNILRIPYVHAIFPESRLVYLVREPFANLASSEKRWRTPISLEHALERLRETPKTQLHYYAVRAILDHVRVRLFRQKYVSVWGVRYPGIYDDLRMMPIEHVIAKQWVECSRQAEADLAEIDPSLVIRLRYEDFVADPVTHFERVLDHFDLTITDDILRALQRDVDPDRQGKWRQMNLDHLRSCIPILRDEMRQHGYSIPPDLQGEHEQPHPVEDRCAP